MLHKAHYVSPIPAITGKSGRFRSFVSYMNGQNVRLKSMQHSGEIVLPTLNTVVGDPSHPELRYWHHSNLIGIQNLLQQIRYET